MKNSIFLDYLFEFPNFFSLFIFTFFKTVTSPILLDISGSFNVSPENMNLIITFFNIGVVVGLLTSIFYNRKFKKIHIILAAYFLTIPVLLCLGLAKTLVFFNILYFISGYLFGLIFISANTNMVEGRVKNKDSVVNLGHSFCAIGALVAPFLSISLINNQVGWNIIYFIIIFLVLLAIILYFIANKKRGTVSLSSQKKIPVEEIFKYKNRNIFFLFSGIIILFNVTSETIISTWIPTFFRIYKMFDLFNAGSILSIFWIGMLVGRLSISFLSYRIKVSNIMIGSVSVTIIALIFTIFADNTYVNFIAIFFVGLGFSSFVPLLISTTSTIYDSGKDTVITILFFLGLSAAALGPYFIKLTSVNSIVFSIALTIIFMFVVLIFSITRVFYKRNFIK